MLVRCRTHVFAKRSHQSPGKTVFIVKGLHNCTLLLATSATTRVRFQSQTVDTVSSCFSLCNLDIHRAEFKENSQLEYHAHLKRSNFKFDKHDKKSSLLRKYLTRIAKNKTKTKNKTKKRYYISWNYTRAQNTPTKETECTQLGYVVKISSAANMYIDFCL